MIVEFTVSVIVPDIEGEDIDEYPELVKKLDKILSNFEEEVGKADLELDDSNWEAYN